VASGHWQSGLPHIPQALYFVFTDLLQFAHYRSLLSMDQELATLVKAVINNEARYVSEYPYCGAFQPPPESNLSPSHNDWADGVVVNP
jgi:meiotically up-regulated gene 157 (Mug157) protein